MFPPELIAVVGTLVLPPVQFSKSKAKSLPCEAKLTAEVAEVLQNLMLKRQADYATSIDEDESMLQDLSIQGRKRLAVQVRVGEKKILRQALAQLQPLVAEARREKPGLARKRDGQEQLGNGVKRLKSK